ncbi:MAG: spore coat associated protein CotJA, partial [Lachnospiraceae bacterium]|nr:spore coat associated protein CotJA [Lachnospiraceae bacterium]
VFNVSFQSFPIALAYVPWQRLNNIYEDLDEAFENGTIFPELNQPFSGRRCCK